MGDRDRVSCGCDLPAGGEAWYDCPQTGAKMTPHFCELYQSRPVHRRAWIRGWRPGYPDVSRTKRASEKKRGCGQSTVRRDLNRQSDAIVESRSQALAGCQECNHYDPETKCCEWTAPGKKKKCTSLEIPCALRVANPHKHCPLGHW